MVPFPVQHVHLSHKGLHVTSDWGRGLYQKHRRLLRHTLCLIPVPSLLCPCAAKPAPAAANAVEKKKLWDAVQPGLNTSAELVATWKGQPLNVPAGPLKSATLVGARVA